MSEARRDPMTILTEALRQRDPTARAESLEVARGGDLAPRGEVEDLLGGAGDGQPDLPSRPSEETTDPTIAGPSAGLAESIPAADGAGEDSESARWLNGPLTTGAGATRTLDPSDQPTSGPPGGDPPPTEWASLSPRDNGAASMNPNRPGRVIAGRYKLHEILGEGGMGIVYRAEQIEPVRRTVALKLVKYGYDSRALLARFDAERQALALMDHPNIARVFDGGATAEGQPFFAMEYVQGLPITRFCDGRRFTLSARLELFVAVCRAVQHAHQKGVIHRDLKPGNVMVTEVDGRPTPKVIDFGLATAIDFALTDLSVHDTGAIVGTPAYMSPEQADPTSMDIDTRTDVYSLGVILYELLVGSPPIEPERSARGKTLEMLRMIREVEPPRPSTKVSSSKDAPRIAANRGIDPNRLTRSLRGELDWITLKALEKDRERRYETVNALARDVERFLADEVVEARPPGTSYRLRKFLRRHRGQAIAAGLVLATLVAGIVGTTIGLVRAEEQRGVAEKHERLAEEQRGAAEEQRGVAEEQRDVAEQQRGIAEQRLTQLTAANQETQKQRDRAERNFVSARTVILDMGERINRIQTGQPNTQLTDQARREAIDEARGEFDRFLKERPDDEQMKVQLAKLHRFAANMSRFRSEFPAAQIAYSSAIPILEDLTRQAPGNPVYRNELALTLKDRADVERRLGRLRESAATLDEAFRRLDSGPIGASEKPYTRTLVLGLIEADQSVVAYQRGLFEDSLSWANRSIERLDTLRNAPRAQRSVVETLYAAQSVKRRTMALFQLNRIPEALTAGEDALERLRNLGLPAPAKDVSFQDSEVRREYAWAAATIPDRRLALVADLTEVIRSAEKLATENPHVAIYQQGLTNDYVCRAEVFIQLGQFDAAKQDLARALVVSREVLDRHGNLSDSLLARARTYLALARAATGNPAEAAEHLSKAARNSEIALTGDPDNFHHRKTLAEAQPVARPPQ